MATVSLSTFFCHFHNTKLRGKWVVLQNADIYQQVRLTSQTMQNTPAWVSCPVHLAVVKRPCPGEAMHNLGVK